MLLLIPLIVPHGLTVRLAERRDLLPIARLVETSFAVNRRNLESINYISSRPRGWLEEQITTVRVGLDIERRLTPWDWARHAQFVAEDGTGSIVGFCEVWGEDAESLRNESAVTPQPVLFNLCVADSARRRGVAQALMRDCEERCSVWGDAQMYLKVRQDNEAAGKLYEARGWSHLDVDARVVLSSWQERWKGSTAYPINLMSKPLPQELAAPRPAKTFDEFAVNIDTVREYNDPDALIWFALLVVRNSKALSPSYRVVPTVLALVTWAAFYLVIKVASHPEMMMGFQPVVAAAPAAL